jgi:hypothetical protein
MPAPIAAVASWIGSLVVSPLEPLKYIDRISPRPLFMLNGTGDPRMPTRCSLLLHEKAKQPKTIRWIQSGHIHVRSEEFHRLVRHELITWLLENDLILENLSIFSPKIEMHATQLYELSYNSLTRETAIRKVCLPPEN